MGEGGILDTVPPQGSYVAKRCPVVAQLDADDSLEMEEKPLTEAQQARADGGDAFETEIFAVIIDLHGEAVTRVEGSSRADKQAATEVAMASTASIVLGGWLPDDIKGHRAGVPDVLVRVKNGWVPVDVKHHGVVKQAGTGGERISELSDLQPANADWVEGLQPSVNALGDSLQLAHYRRLLEAAGLASGEPVGGIIGSDGNLWWIDLAEPRWERGTRSTLEFYDREFYLRLRVISRQLERNGGDKRPPLVVPLQKGECKGCTWRDVCGSQLQEVDSVSLLGGLPWSSALRLIRTGVASRFDLAGLDWDTAHVAHGDTPKASRVDLAEVLAITAGLPTPTPLSSALGRSKRTRLKRLESEGMSTVGDLDRLDRRTTKISSSRIGYLPGLIDRARAAVDGRPFLLRAVDRLRVPRADVEIDVDMENGDAGVYLWGVRISGGASGGQLPRYLSFASWDPLYGEEEAEIFARFWNWIIGLRDATVAEGRTFAAYCYSSAENTRMLRIADRANVGPTRPQVEAFIGSEHWVDLHAVIKNQLITGSGLGLKEVAPLAGFEWRDDDPGGDQSMVWYDRAVNHPDQRVRDENRARLLAYNEDDVEATAVIREWLSATAFRSIEDFAPRVLS
jgi:predicted RecB family nuclease